ncbi:MAG TPA: hypothetical protein VG672_04615 [Bryobacteraceae bacterium]|nr:hypothetical protein [Bryobacteraceae bacterium]
MRRGFPPFTRILLVESGSRHLYERLFPVLRQSYGDASIDLLTCYPGLPAGFPADTVVYRVGDYRGREARRALYRILQARGYSMAGIICSAEPIMTWWKWSVALKVPAKVFVVNENCDFFWLDRGNWRTIRYFLLYRSGLAGAGAVRTLSRVILFPFTVLYLLLYATAVHSRRSLRRGYR